jgi:hypothetical protein
MTEAEVTTETILEHLGLSEHARSKASFVLDRQNMGRTTSLTTSMLTATDVETGSAQVDLDCDPESLSSMAAESSSPSDLRRSSISTHSDLSSLSTEHTWDSIVTESLFESIEAAIRPFAFQPKSPLQYGPSLTDIDTSIQNGFDLHLGSMVKDSAVKHFPDIDGEFGFDPPVWLSNPGAIELVPSRSGAKVDSDNEHRDFQNFAASPSSVWTTNEPRLSAAIVDCIASQQMKFPGDVDNVMQSITIPSARSKSFPPRRPGRPRKDLSSLTNDAEKRRMSLAKNRLAATKSREKKRAEVDALKVASAASEAENRLLKQQVTKLREEILDKRENLFTHLLGGECWELQGCMAARTSTT